MPVYQNSGPSLGESIVRGIGTYLQAKREKEDRELSRRQAEMGAIAGGYRPGAPPTSYVDAPVMTPDDLSRAFQVNAETLNKSPIDQKQRAADAFTASLTDMFMGRPAAQVTQPGMALAKASAFHLDSAARGQARDLLGPTAEDEDVGFLAKITRSLNGTSPTANAPGFVPPSGTRRLPTTDPRYVPISDKAGGGYVDTRASAAERFEQSLIAQQLQQGERERKIRSYVAAGIPAERAALYVDNPALAENDQTIGKPREPKAPVIGSPEWRAAKIEEAKIGAQFGYHAPQQDHFTFPVGVDGNGNPVVLRGNSNTGELVPTDVGAKPTTQNGPTRQQRMQSLANAGDALDAFEKSLNTIGSTVMPSTDKDALQTDYENLQLQLKEMYNLGVLNGPDLALMRRVVGDPTSVTGRAKAFGSGDEQRKRIQAQIHNLRGKLNGFKANLLQGNNVLGPPPTSDPDGDIGLGDSGNPFMSLPRRRP